MEQIRRFLSFSRLNHRPSHKKRSVLGKINAEINLHNRIDSRNANIPRLVSNNERIKLFFSILFLFFLISSPPSLLQEHDMENSKN